MTHLHLPGLIDCHVHFREPGAEHKADMASEAAAANAGGILTVCEMPNTNPGTHTVEALRDKVKRAERVQAACDLRFYFGAVKPEHVAELERLWTHPELTELKKRCCGLKLYLDNSTGDMKADDSVLDLAFGLCGKLGIPLVAHCEHAATNNAAAEAVPFCGAASHSQRRPDESEVRSIDFAMGLAAKHGTQLHIAHLSTADGAALVREAKATKRCNVTAEVTPHHLFLTTADYAVQQARIKVNPPVREAAQEALWAALLDGTIDAIATDHAPHLLSEKADEANPPSGMPGVEVVVRLLLSVAAGHWPHPSSHVPRALASQADSAAIDTSRFTVDHIRRLMFDAPNTIFSLGVDATARFKVNLSRSEIIDEAALHSKCGWSPYHGWRTVGALEAM